MDPPTRQHSSTHAHAPRGSKKRSTPVRQRASNCAASGARAALEAIPTLNSSSQAHGSVLFDRALLLLILANVYVDVMLTVDEWAAQHGAAAKVFETLSSLLFIAEYITRFAVAGERAKYRGTAGRWRFVTSLGVDRRPVLLHAVDR